MAWSKTTAELDAFEAELIERTIFGAPALDVDLLSGEATGLAISLLRAPGQTLWTTGAGPDPALNFFPETGWIHVSGEVETE
jgi:hypothetical protein